MEADFNIKLTSLTKNELKIGITEDTDMNFGIIIFQKIKQSLFFLLKMRIPIMKDRYMISII